MEPTHTFGQKLTSYPFSIRVKILLTIPIIFIYQIKSTTRFVFTIDFFLKIYIIDNM